MSPKTPRVTADRVDRALRRHGFAIARQSGSHRIYRNEAGVRVTLPMHAGKVLHPRLLRTILAEAGIEADEL